MFIGKINLIWSNFKEDKLFRNSVYLILTTVTMGGFGFIFWLISTRIFTPDQIGLGTTLISTSSLVSITSLFGLNNTIIRYIPNSNSKNSDINTIFNITIFNTLVFSLIYLLILPFITPELTIIKNSYLFVVFFILITILSSINSLTDSLFVAFRSTQYNLITDGFVISITKLILPIFFVGLGAYGVFISAGISVSIGMIVSILILIYKFDYKPSLKISIDAIKKMWEFSSINYFGSLLSMLPTLVLPIIIINKIGPAESGYFFLCFMLINILYTISVSISQSLFAEGSYGEDMLLKLLKKALKIIVISLIPSSIALAVIGPYILGFFGESYKIGGKNVIIILSLFSPVVAMYNVGNTLLKIRKHMYSIITTNLVYAFTICFLSFIWAKNGLEWVAFSWIIGNFIAGIISFMVIYYYKHLPTPKNI